MSNPRIGLAMIARNKADIIERALESTKGVFDFYALQDTGSTDDTVKVFKLWCENNNKRYVISQKWLYGDEGFEPDVTTLDQKDVYSSVEVDGRNVLGDFGAARNDSFRLFEGENLDYAFWIDTDDVIVNAEQIPSLAEFCNKNKIHQVILQYAYARPVDGLQIVSQERERLLSLRREGHWVNRVHEHYSFDKPVNTVVPAQLAQLGYSVFIQHERSAEDSAGTNRRNHLIMKGLLDEVGLEDYPDEMLAHMAFDHWEHREFDQSSYLYDELLKRYKDKGVPAEMSFQAQMKQAQGYAATGNYAKASQYAFEASALLPGMPDPYLLLAQIALDRRQWDEVEHYAGKVLALGKPNTTAPINEYDYTVTPRKLLISVAVAKNDISAAQRLAGEILQIVPTNTDAKSELFQLDTEAKAQRALHAIGELGLYLQSTNRSKDLDKLITAIPIELRQVDIIRAKVREWRYDMEHKKHRIVFKDDYKKTIVIFAGQGYEHWDGESDTKKGIGGSEGMCIQMARELSKLGNLLTVYNDCGASDGKVFDGVRYMDWRKWDPNTKCDVFISLRRPDVFNRIIKATKSELWLHDTDYGKQPLEFLYAPNRIFTLSNFHMEVIKQNHGVTDDSIFHVTRNALNEAAMIYADEKAGERNPYQLIYASSYDRGLVNLLKFWPKIKAAVPEATLKIFYGWDTFDRMVEIRTQAGDARAAAGMRHFKSQIMGMIASLDGVKELGRISQNDLYKEFAESQLWVYPTQFEEISCITAMTAQAMGAVPVCTPFAALNETVGKQGIKEGLDRFADAVIWALQNQGEVASRRETMVPWAREAYNMTSLAKEWNNFFNTD